MEYEFGNDWVRWGFGNSDFGRNNFFNRWVVRLQMGWVKSAATRLDAYQNVLKFAHDKEHRDQILELCFEDWKNFARGIEKSFHYHYMQALRCLNACYNPDAHHIPDKWFDAKEFLRHIPERTTSLFDELFEKRLKNDPSLEEAYEWETKTGEILYSR